MFTLFAALLPCSIPAVVPTARCVVSSMVQRAVKMTLVVAVATLKFPPELDVPVVVPSPPQPPPPPPPPPTRTVPSLITGTPTLPGTDGLVNHLGWCLVFGFVGFGGVLAVEFALVGVGLSVSHLVNAIKKATAQLVVLVLRSVFSLFTTKPRLCLAFHGNRRARRELKRSKRLVSVTAGSPREFLDLNSYAQLAYGCAAASARTLLIWVVLPVLSPVLLIARILRSDCPRYQELPGSECANSLRKSRRSFFQVLPWPGSLITDSFVNRGTSLANASTWTTLFRIAGFSDRPTDLRYMAALGEGAFGVVTKAGLVGSPRTFAVKRIRKGGEGTWANLWSEVDIHRLTEDHPAFPTVHGVFRDYQDYILALFYGAQLVLGLQALHKLGVIHRDIKQDNLLLGCDNNLLISDFGLAHRFRRNDNGAGSGPVLLWPTASNPFIASDRCGTPRYASPQVVRGRYSFGVDLWSLGVVLHEWLTDRVPFMDEDFDADDALAPRSPGYTARGPLVWAELNFYQRIFAVEWPRRFESYEDIQTTALFKEFDWRKLERGEYHPPGIT